MDFAADFASAQQALSEALVATTRTATRVAGQDLPFQRSSDPTIAAALDEKSARLLKLTQKLLHHANAASSSAQSTIRLPNTDALDTQWRRVVDAADTLFERADTCLDDFSGLIKTKHNTDASSDLIARPATANVRLPEGLVSASIPKPQLLFDAKPPNYSKPPFQPLLTSKPHAHTPLHESLKVWPEDDGILQHQHPYEDEIRNYRFPSVAYQSSPPAAYDSLESSEPIFVDTVNALQEMLQELKSADVIAVDLEHHDVHSYLGIVSLMQISTRHRDWIIDTLKPWRRKLEMLNEVFADPSIVKVLHGAQMDIVWLQRDFGLYVVGLFDTHHACRVLGYPRASLAFLLKKFVDFDAQKQYQTADWRIRPLPREMLDYARSDTHFLVYVFECMRNELVGQKGQSSDDRDAVDVVRDLSRNTALQRYEFPHSVDDIDSRRNAWAALLTRQPQAMTSEQVSVLAAIYKWRDNLARKEDEGTSTIMPNHAILAVAKSMPINRSELYASVHSISVLLKEKADELLHVIAAAKQDGVGGPDSKAVFAGYPSRRSLSARRTKDEILMQGPDLSQGPVYTMHSQPIISDLRTIDSSFWGQSQSSPDFNASDTFILLPRAPNALDEAAEDRIASITQSATDSKSSGRPAKAHESMTEPAPLLPSKRSAISFVASDPSASSGASGAGADAEETAALEAVQKQARRKARKRARSMAVQDDISGPVRALSEFDYESAPSVLSAQSKQTVMSGSAKGFNPFAKGDSAASGLHRAQEPRAGKSFTYR